MLGTFFSRLVRHGLSGVLDPDRSGSDSAVQTGGSGGHNVIELDEINVVVRGKHGWFLVNRFDQFLGRALVDYGEYRELELELLASLVGSGSHVVEVGASIGGHTVGLAKLIGASGRVIAVEPQPEIYRILCANLALNGLTNVTTCEVGCGTEPGKMHVAPVDYQSGSLHDSEAISLDRGVRGTPVSIAPLDRLVGDLGKFHLLKIDVGGMERDVLKGASRVIKKFRPLLYVANERVEKSKALVEWIMAAGYRIWWHLPTVFNPENFFGESANNFSDRVSVQLLCVPAETPLAATDSLQELTDPAFHVLKQ